MCFLFPIFFNNNTSGVFATLAVSILVLVLYCIYRFLAKNRQNEKSIKNKKLAEDEKILVEDIEEVDVIEHPQEV